MASQKYNILYGRLSQEDERQGESNSIHNQKLFLEKYAADNGFENTLFLSDDGYSGTNFDRPAWKKIVEMIERGEVETLIVKDLSRLGREYLQVGQLMEFYFPEKGIRFIAVNDGVDSLVESSNDFNPIRNWANELHAKDTSKKVRDVKKVQAENGERLGAKPPYGYKKKDAQSKEIAGFSFGPASRAAPRSWSSPPPPSSLSTTLRSPTVPSPSWTGSWRAAWPSPWAACAPTPSTTTNLWA